MSLILSGTDGLSDVDGSASTPAIRGTDTNTGIFFPAADTIAFAEGGAEVARFDSSGNLGIGTSSPSTKLNVFGSSPSIFLEQNSGVAGNTQVRLNAAGGANTASVRLQDKYIWASTASGTSLNIGNNLTTAQMVVDSDGNLCVGTATASGMVTIRQNTSSTTVFRLQDNNGNNRTTVLPSGFFGYMWGLQIYSNGGKAFLFTNASDSEVGSIVVNSGGTSFNTTSDYRLKENIAPMVGGLATVSALKPCTYTWKADGSQGQGFIAHELAEVCPDAVTGEKDAVDAEGNIKPQGIDTSFLVATLTAAIQELKAELDSVKAELATLKA